MAFSAEDALWRLSDIRKTVRKLTGRPSVNQLSNDELDTYINRFYTQELLSLLKLDDSKGWWRFSLVENISDYDVPYQVTSINSVVYVDGMLVDLYTDPSVFNSIYTPSYSSLESVATGNDVTSTYTGTLNSAPLTGNVLTISDDQETMHLQDAPEIESITSANPAVVTTKDAHGLVDGDRVTLENLDGGMKELAGVYTTVTVVDTKSFQMDNVDTSDTSLFTPYVNGGEVKVTSVGILKGDQGGTARVTLSSGAYTITFNAPPSSGQAVEVSYAFSNVSKPSSVLHYDGELRFSPIPDGSYNVEVAVTQRPEALVDENDGLENNDWGELIAYGASKVILSDYGQIESANLLLPRFNELQTFALRKDLYNHANMRSTPSF